MNEIETIINFPFPQSQSYQGVLKPNDLPQEEMNQSIQEFYDEWKKKYLRTSNGKTPGGGYYINMKGTGGDGEEITTSEAHGYGMMIFVYMAGYDKMAKKYFDGMYNMYDQHRSIINRYNMSWKIDQSELKSKDSDSATDGDLDIAFALLLADKQWGSSTTTTTTTSNISSENNSINYLESAINLIQHGLKGGDIDTKTFRIKLGDWQTENGYNTRSSDWMTDHFVAFQKVTGDPFWGKVRDEVYNVIGKITEKYSKASGLMPDFIVGEKEDPEPKPAKPYFLEEKTDGDFSWNACRYPWRISLDYIMHGDKRSEEAAIRISEWIISSTSEEGEGRNGGKGKGKGRRKGKGKGKGKGRGKGKSKGKERGVDGEEGEKEEGEKEEEEKEGQGEGKGKEKEKGVEGKLGNVSKIYAGYTISPQPRRLVKEEEAAFTAPMIVAATVKGNSGDHHQAFVNEGWRKIREWRTDYYGDTINLLCQLVISGNYWVP